MSLPADGNNTGVARFPAWIPWLVAAALAFAAVELAQLYFGQRAASAALVGEAGLAQAEAQGAKNELEIERLLTDRRIADLETQLKFRDDFAHLKITRLVPGPGSPPQARAVAVWNPVRQEGLLAAENLPAPAANQEYRLWITDPQNPNPVSAGAFTVDPETGAAHVVFHPDQPVATAAKFTVSRGRRGGAAKAGDVVVLRTE